MALVCPAGSFYQLNTQISCACTYFNTALSYCFFLLRWIGTMESVISASQIVFLILSKSWKHFCRLGPFVHPFETFVSLSFTQSLLCLTLIYGKIITLHLEFYLSSFFSWNTSPPNNLFGVYLSLFLIGKSFTFFFFYNFC